MADGWTPAALRECADALDAALRELDAEAQQPIAGRSTCQECDDWAALDAALTADSLRLGEAAHSGQCVCDQCQQIDAEPPRDALAEAQQQIATLTAERDTLASATQCRMKELRALYVATEQDRDTARQQLAAALAIYFLLFDDEIGGEIYCVAADLEQASKVFDAMVAMLEQDAELVATVEIIRSQKRIVHRASGSVARAISGEAFNKHGLNASVVIYDELHVAPTRDLWDVLATKGGLIKSCTK